MLSGALQGAIYRNLNGHGGLGGWRWMFVSSLPSLVSCRTNADAQLIDGILTIFVSLLGLFLIPDFPTKPKYVLAPAYAKLTRSPWSFWLRPHHLAIARERTTRFRRSDNKKFTWQTIVRTSKQPLIYFFATLYPAAVLAQQGYNCTLTPF